MHIDTYNLLALHISTPYFIVYPWTLMSMFSYKNNKGSCPFDKSTKFFSYCGILYGILTIVTFFNRTISNSTSSIRKSLLQTMKLIIVLGIMANENIMNV